MGDCGRELAVCWLQSVGTGAAVASGVLVVNMRGVVHVCVML